MFKDCKTGGYHIEGSKASVPRLTSLVLLIAIAYTFSTLKGKAILTKGQKEYMNRLRKCSSRAFVATVVPILVLLCNF